MTNLFENVYRKLTKATTTDRSKTRTDGTQHFCPTCLARLGQEPEPWCPKHGDERRKDG